MEIRLILRYPENLPLTHFGDLVSLVIDIDTNYRNPFKSKRHNLQR